MDTVSAQYEALKTVDIRTLGIVQHGIEKDLLREYCVALRRWIAVYAKIEG